ncbi:hypothetical protein PR048_025901 [Dryococelus australis]|uniref:Uncharacterized protein n=1 Tax=Dryococelus australis TaxID=614101 RepID=A0ABQ9GJV2_9NEOP|nr:hypothetical protein PR048_025901 [Dryococelus australis]
MGFSKFCELGPKWCIGVGSAGMHAIRNQALPTEEFIQEAVTKIWNLSYHYIAKHQNFAENYSFVDSPLRKQIRTPSIHSWSIFAKIKKCSSQISALLATNFLNLCHHGKSPCDGTGGTTKQLAARESLQRPLEKQVLTHTDLGGDITGVLAADLQPGQYVACIYDEWWIGNVCKVSIEQKDVLLSFMHPHGAAHSFHCPPRSDTCWVPEQHIINVIPAPSATSGRQYCLPETMQCQISESSRKFK